MRHSAVLGALLVSLCAPSAFAACEDFTGVGNAALELTKLFEDDCLGNENDVSAITLYVNDRIREIDVSEIELRTSADVEQLRSNTAALLDNITTSLAGVPRDPDFAPLFFASQTQMAADRSKVVAGDEHPAEAWRVDQLKLLGDSVDIGTLLDAVCNAGDTPSCVSAFQQSNELIRHGTLMAKVLFKSNAHIPALTTAYANLDKQWDYYFGNARSQYIWELKFNSWRYDKQLIKRCKEETTSSLSDWELQKFCTDRKDVRLSKPPIGQWILFHPTAAIEYVGTDASGNSSTSAVAIIEVFGYNRFASNDQFPLKWPVGGSLITTVSLDSNGERFGYGAMLHLRNNLSIGVARRDFGGNAEWTWLLSVDLGKLLTNTTAESIEKMKFLDL